MNWITVSLFLFCCVFRCTRQEECCQGEGLVRWQAWRIQHPFNALWAQQRTSPIASTEVEEARNSKGIKHKLKAKKKFKRFLLPLLLAYKLKFFTLIPVLKGGLILLIGAAGLAGFFFALFAAVMGLKAGSH